MIDDPMRRPGHLAYEGLVELTCDGRQAELWGRLYQRDLDESMFDEPDAVSLTVCSREYALVLTSQRPDLPPEEQPVTMPPVPFADPQEMSLSGPLAPGKPWRVISPCEAEARWYGELEVHGRWGELAFWTADLSIIGPIHVRRVLGRSETP